MASLAIFAFGSLASAAVPTVESIAPAGGRLSGDTLVTITGTNFESGATVTIGGNAATNVVVVSATQITCVTPASATTGTKNVVITNPGSETGTLTDGYIYVNDQYAGGTGDGWSYLESADLTMTGPNITISSAANQIFYVNQSAISISTITIIDNTGAITAANDIRVRIPSTFNMTWAGETATIGGGATAKVATAVTYEGSNKILVLNVTSDFAAGDSITISGLSFTSFSAVSSYDNLELDIYNSGVTYTIDDKYIQIKSSTSQPFIGGTGDGWSYLESADLTMTGPNITISSAANQIFYVNQSATAISTITITDNTGAITAANDLRIRIPSTFNMTWDTTDTTAAIGGGASGKVSDSVTYEGSNKILVLNVTSDFSAGDAITVSGLSFTSFSAVSSYDNLELDVYNSGIVYTVDDKYIQIKSSTSQPFIGGTGDGWDYSESSDFKLAISKIAFTTAEQTIIQDQVSSIMTIEIQDAIGTAVTVLSDTTINLTSSSSGGSFSLNSSPWQSISSVTISSGSSSVSFYYKDSNVGTPTITAAESPSMGWTDTTQTVTVQTKTTQFTVSASSPQVAGSAFTLTITAKDADGNTDTSFSATVNLTVNYVSPSSGSGTLSVTSVSSWSNGVATISNETFSDCGTITITATHADFSTKTGTSSNIVFVPYDFTVVASSLDTAASGSDYARHTVSKPFTLTVTARNASAATCPNYKGTANLTVNYTSPSTSQSGSLGTNSLTSTYWTNGVAEITDMIYNKWGTITITATDATLTTQTGTSSNIIFIPKDFSVTLSDPPAARTYYYTNEGFSATVTARDYNGSTISNYAGTITFTGSGLTVPSNYTFTTTDAGSHKFTGINGSSETSTTLSVKDTTYTSITGTSTGITLKAGTIKVYNASGPVGSISVQVKILDSSGNVLTEDDSTTFTVTITEFMNDNNTCISTATSTAATVIAGIATITLKDTEPETVTVTPSATPTMTATAGTVRFGTVSGSGVGVQLWREIRRPQEYEER